MESTKTFLKFWVLYGGTLVPLLLASAKDGGIIPDELEKAAAKGEVKLEHLPKLLFSYAENSLKWAGGLAIVFVLVGGIQYVLGGLTDNKEQGKKTLTYAIMGVAVIVLSWFIVDFFVQFLTE
ncbi:MAG TPA: pilin [Candidatus Gracilibacteria bacterium]